MRGQGGIVGWGCWAGWGIGKQMSTMQETALLGWLLTVGQVGGSFGQGKNIYIWVASI